jgi:hypothetical protein
MAGRGALRRKWAPEKNADGPLPRFYPAAVPDASREASCAPPGRRARHGVARGELATGRCAACNQIRDEPSFILCALCVNLSFP